MRWTQKINILREKSKIMKTCHLIAPILSDKNPLNPSCTKKLKNSNGQSIFLSFSNFKL